jgi:hypothetical protein
VFTLIAALYAKVLCYDALFIMNNMEQQQHHNATAADALQKAN